MAGGVLRGVWSEVAAGVAALLFPGTDACPFCGSHHDPEPVGVPAPPSFPCLDGVLLPLAGLCARCGKPQPGDSGLCGDCWRQAPPFARTRALGVYAGPLREAIHRLKYHGEAHLARPLGALLAVRLRQAFPPPDVIVPVPLHPGKLRRRGFNQSELLAREAGGRLSIPVAPDALARVRATEAQSRLGGGAREANVGAAIVAAAPWRVLGKSVLILDDIYTTGATASACAEALIAAGARRVDVLVVAIGLRG